MNAYLIILFVSAIISFFHIYSSRVHVKSFLIVFYGIVVISFSAFRYHTGWDWEAYDYFFNQLKPIYDNVALSNIFGFEFGFLYLSSLLKTLYISPYVFFSFFTISLVIFTSKKILGMYVYLFFVLYLYYGYFQNFSIIRQALAAAIFIFSVYMLSEKKYKSVFLLSLIAISMHGSAFIFYIIYPVLLVKKFHRVFVILTLIVSPFFVTFPLLSSTIFNFGLDGYLPSSVLKYITNPLIAYKVGFSLKYLEIILLLIWGLRPKVWIACTSRFGMLYSYMLILLAFNLATYSFLNDFSIIYERISVYFEVAQGLFICMLLSVFPRKVIPILVIFCLGLVFLRYERMIFHSDSYQRLNGDAGHYERFTSYCSIFTKETCIR